MTEEDRTGDFTPGRATRFYVPLLIQAFSQCLTYPLVATVVSHGRLGVSTLTAFAQGQTVMFLIGSLGGGLITTGMVFARSRAGYRSFIRLNAGMMIALIAAQIIAAAPPFDALIFRSLLGLPPELAEIARRTLLWGAPVQAVFFIRNVPLAILFNARASAAVNNATFVRIILTLLASGLFVHIGWTGAMWGLVAMSVPCLAELALTYLFARPHARALPDGKAGEPAMAQLRFTLPLSLGGFLLAATPFMIAVFVGMTSDPVAMLAIHYVTIGLANAVGFAALRLQTVAIQFPPEYEGDRRVLSYAVAAGAVLGLALLFPVIPEVGEWYFHAMQGIPDENVAKARMVMAAYAAWPILQTVRGYAEGTAALQKRPEAILAGQCAHLAALVALLAAALALGAPGWAMGVVATLGATAMTAATIFGWLHVADRRQTA